MKSIAFPRMILNKTSSNIIDDRQATKNNIANLLGSEQGTLFGDPFYGIRLKFYMFEQNSKVLKDILIDEIYTQIKVFIPQVTIRRSDIDVFQTKRGEISAKVRVRYVDEPEQQEVIDLVLFKGEQ